MIDKNVIKDLKNRVRELSFKDIKEKDIIRILKNIYYDNVKNKNISYSTYIEITSYLVILKSIRTLYQIK